MSIKETQERHDAIEPSPLNYWDRRAWWRGNWNTGQQAHKDRGELLDALKEIRALPNWSYNGVKQHTEEGDENEFGWTDTDALKTILDKHK